MTAAEIALWASLAIILVLFAWLCVDLGRRIEQVNNNLGKRIDQVNNNLGTRIDQVNDNLGTRIDAGSRAQARARVAGGPGSVWQGASRQ